MSIELMSRVWKVQLSHSQQAVLLAMADFANDDGRNCYPSHGLLAWKTGYSSRQIARLIDELIGGGILQVIKPATNNQPPRYWIRLDKGVAKQPYGDDAYSDDESGGVKLSPQENGGVKMSTPNGSGVDKMSPPKSVGVDILSAQDVAFVTPGGDIAMSPDPSVNHFADALHGPGFAPLRIKLLDHPDCQPHDPRRQQSQIRRTDAKLLDAAIDQAGHFVHMPVSYLAHCY